MEWDWLQPLHSGDWAELTQCSLPCNSRKRLLGNFSTETLTAYIRWTSSQDDAVKSKSKAQDWSSSWKPHVPQLHIHILTTLSSNPEILQVPSINICAKLVIPAWFLSPLLIATTIIIVYLNWYKLNNTNNSGVSFNLIQRWCFTKNKPQLWHITRQRELSVGRESKGLILILTDSHTHTPTSIWSLISTSLFSLKFPLLLTPMQL